MFWLGFLFGFGVAVFVVSTFWAMAFSLKALSGYTFKKVGKSAKWVDNGKR